MSDNTESTPWGTYTLTVTDKSGVVVYTENHTRESGSSMMDNAKSARRHWDAHNPQGAPHIVDW